MIKAVVVTPVKDSPETTKRTIEAVCNSNCKIDYIVYNDFSSGETKSLLTDLQKNLGFELVNLEERTNNPPPNYKLVLQLSQERALRSNLPVIIIESDVIVKEETISELINFIEENPQTGLIGAITTDNTGKYNFPYNFEKRKSTETVETNHSLSFCCTAISQKFLREYSFQNLSAKKDWYDVTISRQAKKMGFINYLAKGVEVLHIPHSSRPWKNLKYSNPLLYYYQKLIKGRDRI